MQSLYWYSGNDGSGSGSDADLIYHDSGNLHASSFSGLEVHEGLVILYYGDVDEIPPGWHLCDGTEGTIDLRDKLVPGAGNTYPVGAYGGSNTFTASGSITINPHALTVSEMGPHRHPFIDKYAIHQGSTSSTGTHVARVETSDFSGTTPNAGSGSGHGHSEAEGTDFEGDAVACMPYSYALLYIQRMV